MKERKELIKYFAIAIGFTWLFWVPDGLAKRGLIEQNFWTSLGFLGSWGPLVATIYLVFREQGLSGVKETLKKGLDYRFGKIWWLIVMLLLPVLIIITYFISVLLEGVATPSLAEGMYQYLPMIYFIVMMTGGPLQEEFGWRGYALERLQKICTPFASTLILGFIWAFWHFPQFLVPYEKTGMFYITPIWSFTLTIMATAFVYTWVYNHTKGNVMTALLMHTNMNFCFWVFPITYNRTGYLWFLAVITITAAVIVWIDRKNFFQKPSRLTKSN
ncbi:MAG TPA: type II CAAX endopeptidase family protein [Erysipelotrichaceae bacterium]|nr:type II CAAX endopeptidase family protein [Erysipelotrichaceae bacterium]HQB32999.1 type II CAAX endopeptidase family protein [Erysipelotrichaceae bacterium]